MGRIRTLIVDDHALFRESVARVLGDESDLEISHCATIQDALSFLERESFDLVLLDHDLGSERAFQFLPAAAQAGFKGQVLIVTAWVSNTEARRLVRQGVAGIFSKQSPLSALANSMRKVAAGQTCFDTPYETLAGEGSVTGSKNSGPEFNDRQRSVLRFVLARGSV